MANIKKKSLESDEVLNSKSTSTSTTKNISTVYLPITIFHSLRARSNYENIDISSIFNVLLDLFINSKLSFFEFKGLITKIFNISYDPNQIGEEKSISKKTLTMNFDKNNYVKLRNYVEKNKDKEYGISISAICVQLAALLCLSNVYLHDFVNRTKESLSNLPKDTK
jgi:hypothetical protein